MVEYVPLEEINLQEALGVLNRNLHFDNIDLSVLRYKTLEDPDFDRDLTSVAMVDGAARGLMVAVCRKGDSGLSAAVKFFAVDEAYRDRGIATAMLENVESRLKARGAEAVRVGFTRPNYLVPGVDPRYTAAVAFLLRRGYTRIGEAFNMDVDLSVSDWPTAEIEDRLVEQGITCRRLRSNERDAFRGWMASAGYSAGWQYQTLRAAEMEPPAVFIAERNGEYVAFAGYDGVRPGWFGPMGTLESMRGSGIGSVTFLRCLQDMKERGYSVCEINSVGPLYFYSKVAGAVVSRIFWQFQKQLR